MPTAAEIGPPALLILARTTLSFVSSDVKLAQCGNNGAVNLTVSGGTTPYSYLWSNSATIRDISGLIAGTYNVAMTISSARHRQGSQL